MDRAGGGFSGPARLVLIPLAGPQELTAEPVAIAEVVVQAS